MPHVCSLLLTSLVIHGIALDCESVSGSDQVDVGVIADAELALVDLVDQLRLAQVVAIDVPDVQHFASARASPELADNFVEL